MKVVIGNKVKFINERLEGSILEILANNKIVVACSDGFDHIVSMDEVIIINADNQPIYMIDYLKVDEEINNNIPIQKTNKGVLGKYLDLNKYKYEATLEIDLHLEELVEFPGKLEDWQKLHTQMQHVKNCLDAAFDKNIQKIVFIHGVGTGVLKTELKNYLADFDNISFKAADFREYGMGATEVIIKN